MKAVVGAGFALASVVVAVSPAMALTNLVINGSFEDTTGYGWEINQGHTDNPNTNTNSDAVIIQYGQASGYPTGAFNEAVPAVSAPTLVPEASLANPFEGGTGTHGLYLSSDTGTQTLSETLQLISGSYTFGFDFYLPQNGMDNPNDATFSPTIGDQSIVFDATNFDAKTWYTFTGTTNVSEAGLLTFSFTANAYPAKDFVIDNVFLSKTSEVTGVPEAATWAMMLAGFGAIGAATRRRRAAVSFG